MPLSTLRVRSIWAIATAVWLGIVGTGFGILWSYAMRPGPSGQAPARWPAESGISRAPDRPTLVMFAHPRCPCTRASLAEIENLMARNRGRFEARVVAVLPPGRSESFGERDLTRSIASLPGVTLVRDEGGIEARRFGAATSGQTLLYDQSGALAFAGGITAARGHPGPNPGSEAILALLRETAVVAQPDAPVFGCHLLDAGALDPTPGREAG